MKKDRERKEEKEEREERVERKEEIGVIITSAFSCTEVLAIRCVGDVVFTGMGPNLYVFRNCTLFEKINCLGSSNIHGIEAGANNKLAVFGARSMCICKRVERVDKIIIEQESIHEFNDWIIAAKWISFKEQMQLAILFAHNYVSIYDTFNKTCRVVRCEETCILYGGSISGTSQENLVIFSGTVFQEILIWKIDNDYNDINKRMPVLHRLTGHKGVIFSVVCDPSSRFICSTSDDRSVRFWKVTEDENSESDRVNWQTVKIAPVKTMFVHTARVWKALIRNDIVLTIGEDSLVCTWSHSGNLLNKAYCKAPIWSIDVSEENTIYVGGGDGSVSTQPFEPYKNLKTSFLPGFLPGNDTRDFPKYVCYLHDDTILVFTELGKLLHYSKEMMHKSTMYLRKDYYIMQVSLDRRRVAFASREGYVKVYEEHRGTLRTQFTYEMQVMKSQIFSLQWLSTQWYSALAVCGANGLLRLIRFSAEFYDEPRIINVHYVLPPSRERWLTAAIMYEVGNNDKGTQSLLICGDRAGNVHVFITLRGDVLTESVIIRKPIQTLHKIHGKIGVQSFALFEENLITSGRDGMLRFYHICECSIVPLSMHKKKIPMDWISGMRNVRVETNKTEKEEVLFIFGFKQIDFIIYDLLNESIVVRIPCGGGHRAWDCIISHTSTSFAYIKNKQVHVCDMSPSLFFSYPILQNGFHTKETCCLRRITIFRTEKWGDIRAPWTIFVSGGEDCALRISRICLPNERIFFKNLGIFHGHLSGIKCISVVELDESKHLIFSGGGRAQLKVWQLNVKRIVDRSNYFPKTKLNVSCSDMNSHMLYGQNRYCKKPWQEAKQSTIAEPETRYMDIYAFYCFKGLQQFFNRECVLIFAACADGYLRLLVYEINTNIIYLKVSTKYVDRCILKIHIMSWETKLIVLTMSTDGKLRFFDFTAAVLKIHEDVKSGNRSIVNFHDIPFAEFSLHQSGINCFDLKKMNENEYLLVTGGDDNLLSIVHFQICMSETNTLSAEILSKWNTSSAHCAQIVGVKLIGNIICSVGIDQQVITYKYLCSNRVIHVDILNQEFTSVTDVQGMELDDHGKHSAELFIYGRGFEIFNLRKASDPRHRQVQD